MKPDGDKHKVQGPPFAVEMRGIVKRFPGVIANNHVDFYVSKGEIHGLVGENGAGKTTLMSILYGLFPPDDGQLLINGEEVHFRSPKDAMRHRIGMVHQQFRLVPSFSVLENVILGSEPNRRGFLSYAQAEREFASLTERTGFLVDPQARVRDLPVGIQQKVEILKLLYREADILILDEPTAVLTPQETYELFRTLGRFKSMGKTVIFITHKLEEVMAITDTVSVLRDGVVTGRVATKDTSPRELAQMMVGREIPQIEKGPPVKRSAKPRLRVENLWVSNKVGLPAVQGVTFEVYGGEILGVAGVEGNGQLELVEAITGLRRAEAGRIFLGDTDITGLSPRQRRMAGISHVPQDRDLTGLCLEASISENFIGGYHTEAPFRRGFLLDARKVRTATTRAMTDFNIRAVGPEMAAGKLSGGNKQKVVLARELSHDPALIVADQPTRGLDVGATEFVHRTLVDMRNSGCAVLLISADLSEVMTLSDRLAVMFKGQIVGIVDPRRTSTEDIGLMMAGAGRKTA